MDLSIINEAATLIRDKFKIGLIITQCSIEIKTTTVAVGVPIYLKPEPELRIELTVTDCHSFFTEDIDLEYIIDEEDLLDGSDVDKVIGGDMKKYAPRMREILRLAFILYNGIRYVVDY